MVRAVALGAGGIIIGLALGYGLFRGGVLEPRGNCNTQYPLLSDTLDCGYDNNASRIRELDTILDKATSLYVRQGKATRVSVWTRDLVTKQWAASNENEICSPASLLKLPLIITFYRFAEVEPSVLDSTLVYTPQPGDIDSTLRYTGTTTLVTGRSYNVEDLLAKMIQNSDNAAAVTLFKNVDPAFYTQTLIDLGVKIPTGPSDDLDYVTVRTYASIFRNLYTASYLDREYSQKVLELMTKSSFKGIAAKLPDTVQVAHKFGERTVIGPDGSVTKHELHDCGIVYKDPHPYSLCIMTEGQNFDDLLWIIEDLSKNIYSRM